MSFKNPASLSAGVISIDAPVLTPKQEQLKWLGEGLQGVEENASTMRAHISRCEFYNVLRSAELMLAELRTGMLAPQYYYELYLKVFNEMQHLEQYFEEERARGRLLEDMYEVVQHTGNIVPRLYLLITVGSVYIKSGVQPAIEIMRDLVEMCKGVQHPTRGLFLRHFLLTMMKNKLPGDSNRVIPNSFDNDGGAVEDTAELILQNFKEMNWLWIRIEAKTPSTGAEVVSMAHRKHKDRKELCVLVGMNIVRLSQLEGVERQAYKKVIFPRLVEIILTYKEALAQQYLLEVIVQVFPDQFHLFTLEELFFTLERTSVGVDIFTILSSLMTRLGDYAVLLREGVATAGSHKEEKLLRNMFDILMGRLNAMFDANNNVENAHNTNNNVNNDINNTSSSGGYSFSRNRISLLSYLKSMLGLINLSLKIELEVVAEHISVVFTGIAERIKNLEKESVVSTLQQIILTVIENIKDPNILLNLVNFDTLTKHLPSVSRRVVVVAFCKASLQSVKYRITNIETCTRLFELIMPLLHDEVDEPSLKYYNKFNNNDDYYYYYNNNNVKKSVSYANFLAEQHLLCRVLHLIQCDDISTQLKLLNAMRKLLGQGGSKRTVVTMPTLASLYINLVLRIAKETEAKNINVVSDFNTNNVNQNYGDSSNSNSNNNNNNNNSESSATMMCTKAFRAIYSGNGKGVLEILACDDPIATFYLYLTSANAADVCKLSDVAYEHYISAFQLYEESAAEMRSQIEMVTCIINSLQSLCNMSEENYELLATKTCQYSSKLIRKSDQSRLVMLCANLFLKKSFLEESHNRIVECLRRSIKIANYMQATEQLPLFVELLNYVLHYYASNAPGVTVNYISAIIDIVQKHLTNYKNKKENDDKKKTDRSTFQNDFGEVGSDDDYGGGDYRKNEKDDYIAACTFYRNTTCYIRSRQEVEERWMEIDVSQLD